MLSKRQGYRRMASIQVVDMSLPPTALLRARLALGTISFDQGYINVPESFFGYIYPLKRLDYPFFCSLHVWKLL